MQAPIADRVYTVEREARGRVLADAACEEYFGWIFRDPVGFSSYENVGKARRRAPGSLKTFAKVTSLEAPRQITTEQGEKAWGVLGTAVCWEGPCPSWPQGEAASQPQDEAGSQAQDELRELLIAVANVLPAMDARLDRLEPVVEDLRIQANLLQRPIVAAITSAAELANVTMAIVKRYMDVEVAEDGGSM